MDLDGKEYHMYSHVRPNVFRLLQRIPKNWEIIILTNASSFAAVPQLIQLFQKYYDYLRKVDKNRELPSFKILTRRYCVFIDSRYSSRKSPFGVKRLELLKRELDSCILVDNSPYVVYKPAKLDDDHDTQSEENNLIPVPTWGTKWADARGYADFLRTKDEDDYLLNVADIIDEIKQHDGDVRDILKKRFRLTEMYERIQKSDSGVAGEAAAIWGREFVKAA